LSATIRENLSTIFHAELAVVQSALCRAILCVTIVVIAAANAVGSEPADEAITQSANNKIITGLDAISAGAVESQADSPPSNEVLWKRAIDRDDIESIRRLLAHVDVKLANNKGKTALMAAVKTGQHELVEKLRQRGLGLADRSFTGGTSLMYAALGSQSSMISYLLDENRRSNQFQSFVDAESTNGWTAVMIAAAKGFDEVVEQLVVEGGANAWLADAYQWTPLMRAIDNRHKSVIDYLLGLDHVALNQVNENGATALHVAVEKGDTYTARLLIERGINKGVRDNVDRTALDIAIDRSDRSLTQLLSQ